MMHRLYAAQAWSNLILRGALMGKEIVNEENDEFTKTIATVLSLGENREENRKSLFDKHNAELSVVVGDSKKVFVFLPTQYFENDNGIAMFLTMLRSE